VFEQQASNTPKLSLPGRHLWSSIDVQNVEEVVAGVGGGE